LLAVLEPSPPPKGHAKAMRRMAMRASDAEARIQRRRLVERNTMLRELDEIGEGRGPSARLALCLLGYGRAGDGDGTLADRIGSWIGYDVHETALLGFEAALKRPLDGTLHETCLRLLDDDCDADPVWPVVAALAQRHEDGRSLDQASEDHVLAALIAKRLRLHVVDRRIPDFADALERFVAADASRFERFLRALIEPQLSSGRFGVSGTHHLLGRHGQADVRIRLLLEWFDRLAAERSVDLEAFVEALLDAPIPLRKEVGAKLDRLIEDAPRSWDGSDRTAYWTALRFVRDFEGSRDVLDAAADDDGFVWHLRRVLRHDRFGGRPIRTTPYEGLVWIFRRFHARWPEIERPNGSGSGSRNAWDASEFLVSVLFGIASDTGPGAVQALHELAEGYSGSYGEMVRAARAKQRVRSAGRAPMRGRAAGAGAAFRLRRTCRRRGSDRPPASEDPGIGDRHGRAVLRGGRREGRGSLPERADGAARTRPSVRNPLGDRGADAGWQARGCRVPAGRDARAAGGEAGVEPRPVDSAGGAARRPLRLLRPHGGRQRDLPRVLVRPIRTGTHGSDRTRRDAADVGAGTGGPAEGVSDRRSRRPHLRGRAGRRTSQTGGIRRQRSVAGGCHGRKGMIGIRRWGRERMTGSPDRDRMGGTIQMHG
jgi:hypothetical protein